MITTHDTIKCNLNLSSCGLGNNLLVLRNCINIAIYYNINISISCDGAQPGFNDKNARITEFISDGTIMNQSDVINKEFSIIRKTNPGFNSSVGLIPYHSIEYIKVNGFEFPKNYCFKDVWKSAVITKNEKLVREYIRNLFIIKYQDLVPFTDKELVIHIRSGDIFDEQSNDVEIRKTQEVYTAGYIVPPLSYYKKIIDNNDYKTIIIVSQDRKNPCIDKLLDIYPNAIFQENKLKDDIEIILKAKHIAITIGTFTNILLELTEYTEKLYYPSFNECNALRKNCICEKINIDKENNRYISQFNELSFRGQKGWVNSEAQRDIILNWEIP